MTHSTQLYLMQLRHLTDKVSLRTLVDGGGVGGVETHGALEGVHLYMCYRVTRPLHVSPAHRSARPAQGPAAGRGLGLQ